MADTKHSEVVKSQSNKFIAHQNKKSSFSIWLLNEEMIKTRLDQNCGKYCKHH